MRHIGLLFAGLAFGNLKHITLRKTLKADSTMEEATRNFSSASRRFGRYNKGEQKW